MATLTAQSGFASAVQWARPSGAPAYTQCHPRTSLTAELRMHQGWCRVRGTGLLLAMSVAARRFATRRHNTQHSSPQAVPRRVAKKPRSRTIARGYLDPSLAAAAETKALEAEDLAEDDDEEEDDDDGCSVKDIKEVFIVSDGTGESAMKSVARAMRQFEYCFGKTCGESRTTVCRFVRKVEDARAVAEEAALRDALVVYTLMDRSVKEALSAALEDEGVESCDLWGGLIPALEKKFGAQRSGEASLKQVVNEEYMQIIKAIEYTRKVDDGILPNMWKEADIMLVGPSRAGKTPLAFYLAQRGFKVANYPIVPEEEPPKELFEIDQSKVFALIIQPERLGAIRAERMAQFGRKNTQYANINNIKKEVRDIRTFYMRRGPKWPVIDTTTAGVVETASRIIEIIDRRRGDPLAAAHTLSGVMN